MATAAIETGAQARGNTRFFTIMAFVMSFIIVAGFRGAIRDAKEDTESG